MLVVLVSCGWTSMLCSVGYMVIILCISVLSYLWFSPYLGYECIPSCDQTSQPEKHFKNPKNLVLFDWIFEIVLACFFVVWKQFLAQTYLAPLLGNEVENNFFPGILIISLVLRGELKPAYLIDYFSPVCHNGYHGN